MKKSSLFWRMHFLLKRLSLLLPVISMLMVQFPEGLLSMTIIPGMSLRLNMAVKESVSKTQQISRWVYPGCWNKIISH
jgi:hypothetical protein